ncbi:FecR family protein [Pedobacter sp. MC2016-24]|uniref:FecR family protein n=1 Tax=Pedobacter sp. MC2016-24 TaxID=2780090 RepID=UPI0018824E14|nr:FecR domain-containing protein [Pedobacter sp. MC2016-24]MBE9601937.1 FecR domain-containing protein [Pedobacter sp. MC2016-24]
MTIEEALYIERIMVLLAKKHSNELTESEHLELSEWLEADEKNIRVVKDIEKGDFTFRVLKDWRPEDATASLQRINQRIYGKPARKLWQVVAVAATIAIVLFGAGLFYFQNKNKQEKAAFASQKDILPGRYGGATLTLANGEKIRITDAKAGDIANQQGVKISKTADGQILYEIAGTKLGNTEFNTLSTACGEQAQVKLPDGTLVFLNAASSLAYPTTFKGLSTRETSLKGEAYFQVAKDKKHPFIVKTKNQQVEVLGTRFNINAYDDDHTNITKTTLEEGSVKVSAGEKELTIIPGEQASIQNNKIAVIKADLEEVLAWKNGYFRFNGEKITSIMTKLSRWYNIDVVYLGPPTDETFTGTVSSDKNLGQALKILQNTNGVKFKVEGRRVTVMP